MKTKWIVIGALSFIVAILTIMFLTPTNLHIVSEYMIVPVERMVEVTDMIVIAQVESSYPVLRTHDNELELRIWTITTLKPENFLKNKDGLNPESNIEIIAEGGNILFYNHESNSAKFQVGERVLLFLDKDSDSIMGDNYYVIWGPIGKYILKNGIAENIISERTMFETELISIISP